MFSQKLADATSANAAGTLGGINPRQVGLGSIPSTIDVIHSAGAFQSTDRILDVTIMDEGFFAVTDGPDVFYTRSGNLYIDSFGYLITAGGQYLTGMMLLDELPEDFMEEEVVAKIADDPMITWGEGKEENNQILDLVGDGGEGLPIYLTNETRDEVLGAPGEGGGIFGRIVIPTIYRQISIDESGVVKAVDEEGNAVNVAVIITATFQNTGGLTKVGENLYRQSANSGSPAFSIPGIGPSGGLKAGGLEMSNVDLAQEFTTMIVTQRGYQANARIITVSDTMLEELTNLKR
jgi:flagellar hook protein FlgE